MGYLELKLYNICEVQYNATVKKFILDNWSRFLDDCEILLDKNLIKPEQLLSLLNSIHKEIQFTMESSDSEIAFLDVLIKRTNQGISLDLYRKPTDTQHCLNFESCHPTHCKTNIPFSMARRICTIVENASAKLEHLKKLKENLKKYHYPEKIVENGITKALGIPQEELRKAKEPTKENVLAFVSTYNPNNPKAFTMIKNAVQTLKENNVVGFRDINVIHGRRQPPNLKRILTTAEFSFKNKEHGVYKCESKLCKCCDNLLIQKSYTFKNINKEFVLKTRMDCNSSNLIYVVICPTCKEEYIGETGMNKTALRNRVTLYRQHINDPKYEMLKVEKHLRECGKGNFKIFPFLQLRQQDTTLRRTMEQKFIKKFKTRLN